MSTWGSSRGRGVASRTHPRPHPGNPNIRGGSSAVSELMSYLNVTYTLAPTLVESSLDSS